jgi:S-adenosylmethionine synthetase
VLAAYEAAGKAGWGVVLRVPVLYGEAESPAESAVNVLVNSIWKAQEKAAAVKMDHWAIRYPTNTEDVGRVCQGVFFFKQSKSGVLIFLRRSSQIPRD